MELVLCFFLKSISKYSTCGIDPGIGKTQVQ
jgi:hypothetical protein